MITSLPRRRSSGRRHYHAKRHPVCDVRAQEPPKTPFEAWAKLQIARADEWEAEGRRLVRRAREVARLDGLVGWDVEKDARGCMEMARSVREQVAAYRAALERGTHWWCAAAEMLVRV